MNIFKKYKSRMIVTFVAIILIVIISITASGRKNVTDTENVLGNIITPVQKVFNNIGNTVFNPFSSIGNIFTIKKQNEELKKEVVKLNDEVRKYENIIAKTEYLKNEADLVKNTKYSLVKAQIIGKDPGNWFEKFVIDKGLKDGINKGDIIVEGIEIEKDVVVEGLVGRVVEVGNNWAKVMSAIDGGNSVSFIVGRTQDGGIAKGDLKGSLSGQLFDIKSDVVKGDKLFTSGLGGVFTKEIYIGEVSKVIKKSDNLLIDIEIKPAVNFSKLSDVFVIKQNETTKE